MTETDPRPDLVSRNVGAAAEAVLHARGEAGNLMQIFEHSSVPMVMVDSGRRYVEVNLSARLWFRRSRAEMRTFVIDDLPPTPSKAVIERAWARLHDVGCVAGRCPVYGNDGSRLDVVYYALTTILPGLDLIAFAPAEWPEEELAAVGDDRPGASPSLTPREIEVLALAADGLSTPDVARELVVSVSTVSTHFENIYVKLDVRNRAAAVAKAMRLGVIE
jgi:DNA-binding CsgD family transcriptional regulator